MSVPPAMHPCPTCKGTGYETLRGDYERCETCNGQGVIFEEDGEPPSDLDRPDGPWSGGFVRNH